MTTSKQKDTARRAIALGETALTFARRDEVRPLLDHFSVCPSGLVIDGTPSFEECDRAGKLLVVTERAIQFALGDYINYMESRFGEQAAQVIDFSDGWSEDTCAKYAWLARRIHPERRRMDRLGVRHHLLVAPLAPSLQTKWLTRAAADEEPKPWTVARLKAAMDDAGELPLLYGVTAFAKDEEDQAKLVEQIESGGRACKTFVKRASGKRGRES